MIDVVPKEFGIEGGSLSRLPGLMREASDMQRVAKEAGAGEGKGRSSSRPASSPPASSGGGEGEKGPG